MLVKVDGFRASAARAVARRWVLGAVNDYSNKIIRRGVMRAWWRLTRPVLLSVGVLIGAQGAAQADAANSDLDLIDWELAKERMAMLSQLGYHPFLMPLIMENRDAIGLSNEQVRVFREWRNRYRVPLIHMMNQIIAERVAFQRIALNPRTSEEVLLAKQNEIFKLHKKVLDYQLSCRRTILDTFTDEQWDNFRFVLTESGYVLD
jgi:hypothetical protein